MTNPSVQTTTGNTHAVLLTNNAPELIFCEKTHTQILLAEIVKTHGMRSMAAYTAFDIRH